MEVISSAFDGTLNRTWKRRRYQRFDGSYKKNLKSVTIGGRNRRFWKIKSIPRLKLKKASSIRLWIKFKNIYLNMMLRLGVIDDSFGARRVPKSLPASRRYSMEEFQSRLIYEISKNLYPSRELTTI